MANVHLLTHRVYPPRTLGFSIAVALTAASFGLSLFEYPSLVVLLIVCLVYPHAAYQTHLTFFPTSTSVRWSMAIDAVLAGLLIVANNYYLLSVVAYLSFVVLSTAIIAGIRAAFLVATLVSFVVGFSLLFQSRDPGNWFFETSRLIEVSYLIAIVSYPTFVAWHVFKVTLALTISKRESDHHYQALKNTTEHLRRYLSPQLFSALVAKPEAGTAKRKRLTLCFTDLAGFTEVMDRLPEHEITGLLNEYLNAMATIAIQHGGTVDKFMGDGLMIFFGDPGSNGARADAIACVRMAVGMRNKLERLSQEWNERGLDNCLTMRIGIHTGYCAVGNFGSETRMDYTAIGSSVNIASRIEAAAGNGEILLSEATLRLIGTDVETKNPVVLQLKGIQQPISCSVLGQLHQKPDQRAFRESKPGFHLEYDLNKIGVKEVRASLLKHVEGPLSKLSSKEQSESCVRLLR